MHTLKYHAHYVAMALRHNAHVMSEKPMARTWLEAMDVAEAEKSSSAFFQLNDDNVFPPRFMHLHNIVANGDIGDVTDIWLNRGGLSSNRADWFYDPVEAGGGAIFDYGSHAVMGAWYILGLDKIPAEVRSLRIGVKERTRYFGGAMHQIEVDDDAHFRVLFRNPSNGDWCTAMVEATFSYPEFGRTAGATNGHLVVHGSEARLSLFFDEGGQEHVRIERYNGGEHVFPIKSYKGEEESFNEEISSFCRNVLGGTRPLLSAGLCCRTIQVINAAQFFELLGRRCVTIQEIDQYVKGFTGKNLLEARDKLVMDLNKPHRSNS